MHSSGRITQCQLTGRDPNRKVKVEAGEISEQDMIKVDAIYLYIYTETLESCLQPRTAYKASQKGTVTL